MDGMKETAASFEALRDTLLEMGQERSVGALLQLVVKRLAAQQHVALARIWIQRPGDICGECRFSSECPNKEVCLHLAASCGNPTDDSEDWDRIDGSFRRIPLGVRKVGHVALTKEPIEVRDVGRGSRWIADPDWAAREQIRGFVGQPLLHRGNLLGILGVFLRVPVVDDALLWLRIIADHASAAIVNARAFEEIDHLRSRLALENEYLKEELNDANLFSRILGNSNAITTVLEQIRLVAPTDTSVLILGESGTGKELVAREIHQQSQFRDGPLVRVNCASVPQELFESEFFGHVKGSFTGALHDRAGRFELAQDGTLFLDEIGDVPKDMQSKLLRVLQERTYDRIGDIQTRTTNARIVAATNKNLKMEVAAGRFREDLYYRLNVFPIEVPALRDRPSDIFALARHFLELNCRRFGVKAPRLTSGDLEVLTKYSWPGNVRELQNIVEQAALRLRAGPLRFHIPPADDTSARIDPPSVGSSAIPLTYAELKELERNNLIAALERCNWKIYGKRGAAQYLGLHPATLTSKLKAMQITRPES